MKPFHTFALCILVLLVACASPTVEPTATPRAPNTPLAQPQPTQVAITPAPTTTRAAEATRTLAPTPNATRESKPIKVGVLTDQTGTFAVYSAQIENGIALGLEYATDGNNAIAGRAIQVIVKDTASRPETGIQVARELIENDQVDVLVGVPSAQVALAVADLARQFKKIYIAQPTIIQDISGKNFNPYVFRTSRTSTQDLTATGAALRTIGRNFVQVASETQLGIANASTYYAIIRANGGRFAVNDSPEKYGAFFIPQEAKDFTPILQRVLESGADTAVVTWTGPGLVPMFTQMNQVGIFKAMKVFAGMADNQTIKTGYGTLVGAYGVTAYHYALPKNAVNDWLVQKYKDKYKVPPDLFVESSFTSAQLLVAALRATNGDANADKLSAALEKTSFDGLKGKYTVRDYDHVLLQPLYVVRLRNVDDPDFKFFDLIAELRPEETAPPCFLENEFKARCPR
ncbi:MAG: ABC transporter substrate-binding protein [Chloroflexi bacterium]|nr:ABC transporter substrate-binding protein [Chloroflexota bacterium]